MSRGFNEDKLAKANIIRNSLRRGRQIGAGHMIRMVNLNTEEEFVLYVDPKRSPREELQRYMTANGHHFNPIECYDMSIDLENQVQADSTQNWDRHLSVQTGPITGVVPGPIGNEGPDMPNQDPDEFVGRNKK